MPTNHNTAEPSNPAGKWLLGDSISKIVILAIGGVVFMGTGIYCLIVPAAATKSSTAFDLLFGMFEFSLCGMTLLNRRKRLRKTPPTMRL